MVDAPARVKGDPLGRVPRHGIDKDVVGLVAAREDAREKNAVVVAAGFVAEHHDVEAIAASARDEIVHEPRAGHAVSDDDEPLFTHRSRFARRKP